MSDSVNKRLHIYSYTVCCMQISGFNCKHLWKSHSSGTFRPVHTFSKTQHAACGICSSFCASTWCLVYSHFICFHCLCFTFIPLWSHNIFYTAPLSATLYTFALVQTNSAIFFCSNVLLNSVQFVYRYHGLCCANYKYISHFLAAKINI